MTAVIISPVSPRLHAQFLSLILPYVERHARVVFRHFRCPDRKEDAVCECVAVAWRWFLRLVKQGKDPAEFPSALATFAARAVRCGRRLARMERPRDVLSPRAQQEHGFSVESLPLSTRNTHENLYSVPHGQQRQDAFEERLRDNTITPVPDQVSFRLDFPAWLKTRSERDRRVVQDLMAGERTQDVAARHGLTAGRISQLRREFLEDWRRFTDDGAALADNLPPVPQGGRGE
jgi:hypothetical protein